MAMAETRTISIDDEALTQQVYHALEGIKPLSLLGSPLHIKVNDGVVTLRGVVATPLCKREIVRVVHSVPGVQWIDDELWV